MKLHMVKAIMCLACIVTSKVAMSQHPLDTVLLENDKSTSYEALLEEHKLTGLSFAVIDNYKVVFNKQVGMKAHGSKERIDSETAFSTASITKGVVGILAAMLDEQGKLDLDAPVSTYLKRWSMPDSPHTATTPVTLRHLLTHTAGTTQHGFTDFYMGDDIPSLVDSLEGNLPRYDKPISVTFKPGTSWRYSGGGFVIAQVAIEDHLETSLADLAQEMIFAPLNMHNTTFRQHGEKGFLTNIAKVHNQEQEIIKTGIPICPQIAPSGMWSTPTDMAALIIEMQLALSGKKTTTISKSVAQGVTRLETLDGVGGWSVGWMRYEGYGNIDWFSHGGSNTGTGGHVMGSMTKGKGLVIFGNGPNPARIPVINKVRDSVIAQLNWAEEIKGQVADFSPKQKAALQGRYVAPFNDVVEIREDNKELKMVSQFFTAELLPLNNGNFAMDGFSNQFSLRVNPADQKTYITYLRDGSDLLSYAMVKLDKGQKLPAEMAGKDNMQEVLIAYQRWQQAHPNSHLHTARVINREGYDKLKNGQVDAAITLFTVYTKLYPDDANAYDSLAEAYKAIGDIAMSIKHYKRAIEMNPNNVRAKQVLRELMESTSR